MARGKYAARRDHRHTQALEARVAELESELKECRSSIRRREEEHRAEVAQRVGAASRSAVERMRDLYGGDIDDVSRKLANSAWFAQRVAMTEHFTWLFFKGYLDWDRLDGDREVLNFLATHGDLKAWFALTGKYGHRQNHQERRDQKRRDPIREMLSVLSDIEEASKGRRRFRESRKALDAVVEKAREAFTSVTLREVQTDQGWVSAQPTDDQVAIHAEIMRTLPRFREVMDRVS